MIRAAGVASTRTMRGSTRGQRVPGTLFGSIGAGSFGSLRGIGRRGAVRFGALRRRGPRRLVGPRDGAGAAALTVYVIGAALPCNGGNVDDVPVRGGPGGPVRAAAAANTSALRKPSPIAMRLAREPS
jgi:hypothetical protein